MGGWNAADSRGWRVRHVKEAGLARSAGRFTLPDLGIAIVAFLIHWELCVAFLALKLWQQASGHRGNVFAFAREQWERLVAMTRSIFDGVSIPTVPFGTFGMRSSGNAAFDAWRREELNRIEAERAKLRAAERDFAAYREGLLHGTDREDFDRFMQARR